MSTKNKIDIEELRKAVNALLDHLRDAGMQEVELRKDYYLETDAEQLYDAVNVTSNCSVGSLFDDWESVRDLAAGKSEPVVLLLLKIAPLFRYIGDTVTEVQLSNPTDDTGT